MSGWIADHRVADDQASPLRSQERYLAGTLSAGAYHFESADFFASVKLTVERRALRFRIRSVVGMNVRTRAGALANPICRAHVISIGDENPADTLFRELAQNFIAGLDRIDT